MDRYLFEQFVFEMDDETYGDSCVAFTHLAENMVRKPDEKKMTLNYYPQDPHRLQLVVEGVLEGNSFQVSGLRMHHVSEDAWKLKIVGAIDGCDGSYLATRPDGNGVIAVRLVNEQVLGEIKCGDIIEAQMVAFALDTKIYQDETAYANSISPSADGQKLLMKDGLVVATNFIVNNSAKLTDEERENREHSFDNLVDIRGTITKCNKFSLKLFDMDLNNYYMANVMTDFGQLKIFIAHPLFPQNVEGFGVGNVIVAKAVLSADVCIYDYDKYITLLKE